MQHSEKDFRVYHQDIPNSQLTGFLYLITNVCIEAVETVARKLLTHGHLQATFWLVLSKHAFRN